MASKKPRRTTWTPDDEARWSRTTRLVEERISYHQEMSRLLGERDRERERLAQLRRAAS